MRRFIDNTFYGTLKKVVMTENGYRLEDFDSKVDRTFYKFDNNHYIDYDTLTSYGISTNSLNIYENNIVLDYDTLIPLNGIIDNIKRSYKKNRNN